MRFSLFLFYSSYFFLFEQIIALDCFYNILRELPNHDSMLSDFNIETAKASVIYKMFSQRSTPIQVIGKSLENALIV